LRNFWRNEECICEFLNLKTAKQPECSREGHVKTLSSERDQQSIQLLEDAERYSPGGVHSNFRLTTMPRAYMYEKADGARLYDIDGNGYIDYALGMGPAILGHSPRVVIEAVARSLWAGQCYGGQHPAEVDLAREICRIVPCADKVRLSLTGSEAIQAAVRVARAYTRRWKIIKFEGHYHGWCENIYVSVHPTEDQAGKRQRPNKVACTAGQDPLAFENLCVLPWNDIEAFRRVTEDMGNDIAAVVMEPMMCNTSVILPRPEYLEAVRELCHNHGILLIFDEVITGFRVSLSGAQGYLGVTPDLAVFAKALATGFPISCLAGSEPVMRLFSSGEVMHGGTFNSNVVSCVAALATLRELESSGVYQRLVTVGSKLMEGLRGAARRLSLPLLVQGIGPVFHTTFTEQSEIFDYRDYLKCDLTRQKQFVEALVKNGVRITSRGTWFLSTAHTDDDIDTTIGAAETAMKSIQ
jgi:glutamate-1-semialdehyde 2,1-aminomutase